MEAMTLGNTVSEELCELTWTASVDRCSTLYQRKEASWRLYGSCDQSWPPLGLEEASSVSLAPLEKDRCNYIPITDRFLTGLIQVHVKVLFLSLRLTAGAAAGHIWLFCSFMLIVLVFVKVQQ